MYHKHIIITSIIQAFQELRANKLRTFLSLLGISIGIFCIIAVLTVVDSLKNNIQKEMSTLGSNVLYVNRWPWMDEGGAYKWWDYWRRPSMSQTELKALEHHINGVELISLCLPLNNLTIKHQSAEAEGVSVYAVTNNFEKLQNIELSVGRYLSPSELDGGVSTIVIGQQVYQNLFSGNIDPIGKSIIIKGRRFIIVGLMKKVGQNMAGFDFDNGLILPYQSIVGLFEVNSLSYDPFLMIKAATGKDLVELKDELIGVLRRVRKVRPSLPNDFAVNQLSQVTERLDMLFGQINKIGWVIAGFSLIVGGFGIANIMFVTVRERSKIIGLKKAIGARSSSILLEFLIESITLSIAGGIVGVLLVLILGTIVTSFADFPIVLTLNNFILGIVISAFVGVLSGFIPARAASKLNPVVAIRSN